MAPATHSLPTLSLSLSLLSNPTEGIPALHSFLSSFSIPIPGEASAGCSHGAPPSGSGFPRRHSSGPAPLPPPWALPAPGSARLHRSSSASPPVRRRSAAARPSSLVAAASVASPAPWFLSWCRLRLHSVLAPPPSPDSTPLLPPAVASGRLGPRPPAPWPGLPPSPAPPRLAPPVPWASPPARLAALPARALLPCGQLPLARPPYYCYFCSIDFDLIYFLMLVNDVHLCMQMVMVVAGYWSGVAAYALRLPLLVLSVLWKMVGSGGRCGRAGLPAVRVVACDSTSFAGVALALRLPLLLAPFLSSLASLLFSTAGFLWWWWCLAFGGVYWWLRGFGSG